MLRRTCGGFLFDVFTLVFWVLETFFNHFIDGSYCVLELWYIYHHVFVISGVNGKCHKSLFQRLVDQPKGGTWFALYFFKFCWFLFCKWRESLWLWVIKRVSLSWSTQLVYEKKIDNFLWFCSYRLHAFKLLTKGCHGWWWQLNPLSLPLSSSSSPLYFSGFLDFLFAANYHTYPHILPYTSIFISTSSYLIPTQLATTTHLSLQSLII